MIYQGTIINIWYNGEFGCYQGEVECPKCGDEVKVSPMRDAKCSCGLKWDFNVQAEGYDAT